MRKSVKFKNYKKIENISCAYRSSFYNLKRTKWDFVKRRLLGVSARKKYLKMKILNLYKVKRETRFWSKISTQHRQHYSLIKKLGMSSCNSLANKFYYSKHSKNYQQRLLKLFIQSSLKLDVLLWLSGIFSSTKFAKLQLLSGLVYLNKTKVFKPVFLKKNDLIQIQYPTASIKQSVNTSSFFFNSALFKVKKLICKKYTLKKKKRKFKLSTFFFQFKKKFSISLRKIKKVTIVKKRQFSFFRHLLSFLEIDLYSKQLVVIKDLSYFNFKDVCLSAKEYFDVQQI
jgi:ribosomal 50S subunit-recycling heat shock protein